VGDGDSALGARSIVASGESALSGRYVVEDVTDECWEPPSQDGVWAAKGGLRDTAPVDFGGADYRYPIPSRYYYYYYYY
jgi:hypothetical protein